MGTNLSTLNGRLSFFNRTSEQVEAYRQFLSDNSLGGWAPVSPEEWLHVPVTDKRNYFSRFSPSALSPYGCIASIGHSSSGSSGQPSFWFRGAKQKRIGNYYYAAIIDRVIGIPPGERTLVVVCFGMGVWVAGTYTLLAFEGIGEKRQGQLTVLSPGMNVEDIAAILTRVSGDFDHTVIIGYPAALDFLFRELRQQEVVLPTHLHLVTSGDKVSEEWRNAKMAVVGAKTPNSILNIYGSADGGLLAIETPLSIEIRKAAMQSPELSTEIFGESSGPLPALFQFDPRFFFFEEIDGELVITADLDMPLIRYNIHDRGKVITHDEMLRVVDGLGLQNIDKWRLPFVCVSGRTDVAVVIYGAKLYPEAIRESLFVANAGGVLTGGFMAYSVSTEAGERFCLDLEVNQESLPDQSDIPGNIERIVQEELIRLSTEYRNSCQKLGCELNRPKVSLYAKGDGRLMELRKKSPVITENGQKVISAFFWPTGAKPKMVTLELVV